MNLALTRVARGASCLALLATLAPLAPCALIAAPLHPTPATRPDASLEAALATVTADKVSADLHFIASDDLGGRDTPSDGLRVAARFIRARLQRLGWHPGAQDGYFFTYKLANQQIDEAGTSASVARDGQRVDLKFGSDYFFHYSGVTTAETSGGVLFCEDGQAAQFEGRDLNGKWALCFDSGSERVSSRSRQTAAKKAGAVGVIVTPGPDYKDQDYEVRYADYAARARRPSVRPPAPNERWEPPFPTVYLTAKAAERVFALARAGTPDAPLKPGQELSVVFTDKRREVGEGGMIEVENVCGWWPGSDPELRREVMIVSAHYDHVGTDKNGVVFNGADDNGSGTCGLLAIAEALSLRGPLARSVMLIWVSGEEKGLWGSEAWTRNPWLPDGASPVCDINIDMIGRNAPDKLLITPTRDRKEDFNGLVKLAEELAPLEGFPKLGSCDEYWYRSDHMNFAKHLKIPVTFLFSDVHEDYHKSTDDPDKIDYDKIRRVVRLVLRMLDGMAQPGFNFAGK
jgi:hypothetical protein